MEPKKGHKYTYAELKNADIEGQWELIDGIFYAMGSPTPAHQKTVGKIFNQLYNSFEDNSNCDVFSSPLDVLFPQSIDINDTSIDKVQPDTFIVCNPDFIKESYIQGPPVFIVEVLSPSNASWDCIVKRELYERNGVDEYWIIDIETVNVLILKNGIYRPRTVRRPSKIKLSKFDIYVVV